MNIIAKNPEISYIFLVICLKVSIDSSTQTSQAIAKVVGYHPQLDGKWCLLKSHLLMSLIMDKLSTSLDASLLLTRVDGVGRYFADYGRRKIIINSIQLQTL